MEIVAEDDPCVLFYEGVCLVEFLKFISIVLLTLLGECLDGGEIRVSADDIVLVSLELCKHLSR